MTIANAQAAVKTNDGSGTADHVTGSYGSATTTGNLLIGCCWWYHATATCSMPGGWTSCAPVVRSASLNDVALQMFWRISAGETNVRMDITSAAPLSLMLFEWSGTKSTGQPDAVATTGLTGNGANQSVDVITVASHAGIVAMTVDDGDVPTAGSGYQMQAGQSSTFWYERAEDNVDLGAAGTHAANFVVVSGNFAVQAASFAPAIAAATSGKGRAIL